MILYKHIENLAQKSATFNSLFWNFHILGEEKIDSMHILTLFRECWQREAKGKRDKSAENLKLKKLLFSIAVTQAKKIIQKN